MRKDFRIKNYPDLQTAFGDYNEVSSLTHYWRLFSADDDSIDSSIPNLKNVAMGKPAVGNNITSLRDSPYNDVAYSSNIELSNESYYRIEYGNDTNSPFQNNGKKMTISMWFSLPKLYSSGNQIIFSKIKAGESAFASQGEISLIYNGSTDRFVFEVNGKNSDVSKAIFNQFFDLQIQSKTVESFDPPIKPGDWIHVSLVLNTDIDTIVGGLTTINNIFKIFINGKVWNYQSLGGDGASYGGTNLQISSHWKAFDNGGDIIIGRGTADTNAGSLATASRFLDFAVWNTALSPPSIYSVYSTSQYFEGTGFLSLGPRVQLKKEVQIGQVYYTSKNTPKIKTVDPRPGLKLSSKYPFDDTNTVLFDTTTLKELQYPTGLPAGGINNDLRVSASLATPNSLPTMETNSQEVTFSAPGYENIANLEDYYVPSQVEEGISLLEPFNDALVAPSVATSFYGPTTSIHGFDSSVKNKVQIILELPVNEVAKITRHSAEWDAQATHANRHSAQNINPHYDEDGEFFGEDLSGFLYYNLERGVWEQKGLHDIHGALSGSGVAQQTTATDLSASANPPRVTGGHPKLNSGSSNFLRMFYPGGTYYGYSQYPGGGLYQQETADGASILTDLNETDKQLAANVGSPIASHYAPNAIQYFATSSQTLKMRDFIEEPFLLEKVVLEIPDTAARKVYDFSSFKNSPTAGRPQDDYVFFLMRQEKCFPGSSPQAPASVSNIEKLELEASSSLRYLICSGAASFYNNHRRIPGKLQSTNAGAPWELYNTPCFSYNFNQSIDSTTPASAGGFSFTIVGGKIKAITGPTSTGGSGYIAPPRVNLSGGGYSSVAKAIAHVENGSVTSITVTDEGAGYSGDPTLSFTAVSDIEPLVRSGSLNLEMVPAVGSTKSYGNMFVPTWNGYYGLYVTQSNDRTLYSSQSCTIPGFWPGGTSVLPLSGAQTGSRSAHRGASLHTAKDKLPSDPYSWNRGVGDTKFNRRTFFEVNTHLDSVDANLQSVIDPRSYKPFGGGGSEKTLDFLNNVGGAEWDLTDAWNNNFADDHPKLNARSPYLLFPEDEIILGVDAALGWTSTMAAGVTKDNAGADGNGIDQKGVVGANNLTGSLLKIEKNQVMYLRLYGSLVKDQVEAPKFPRSDLNQNNISEPIIGEHVLDKYDVAPVQANSGSYRQRLITGSMVNGEGPARVENFGSEIRGAATNNFAFIFQEANSAELPATDGNLLFQPSEFNNMGAGASQSTVLTCSIPSGLTGLKYPSPAWGSYPAGGPMNTFYIRFVSASVGSNYLVTEVLENNPGGKIIPAPDEIWCRTGASTDVWENDMVGTIVSIYTAFNGTGPTSSTATGNYYNAWGSAFGAAPHQTGVPNITAGFNEFPYNSLNLSSEGAVANRILITQMSCSQTPHYVVKKVGVSATTDASPIRVDHNPVDNYFVNKWMVKIEGVSAGAAGTALNGKTFKADRIQVNRTNLYVNQFPMTTPTPAPGSTSSGGFISFMSVNDNYNRAGTDAVVNGGLSVPLDDNAGTGNYYRPEPGGLQLGLLPMSGSSLSGGLLQANPVRAVAASAARGNMGEFGAFKRNIALVCRGEKYWDSAPPNVPMLWAAQGLRPTEFNVADVPAGVVVGGNTGEDLTLLICGISAGKGFFSNQTTDPVTSEGTLEAPFSSDWWGSFPFEPKYSRITTSTGYIYEIPRMFGIDAVTNSDGGIAAALYWITNDVYAGWGQPYTAPLSGSVGVDFSFLLAGASSMGTRTSTYGSAQVGLSLTMDSQTYGQIPHLAELAKTSLKTFFGIGDGYGNLVDSRSEQSHYPTGDSYTGTGIPDSNGIYPEIYQIFRRMHKPRGWKYGLINALPQYTQAVFRSDHYGQFRDMLEGRHFGIFTRDNDPNPNTQKNEPTVEVNFVQPVWDRNRDGAGNPGFLTYATPSDTRSGNLSMHATSSLPYFDESWGPAPLYPFGRDRPNEIPLDGYIFTLE